MVDRRNMRTLVSTASRCTLAIGVMAERPPDHGEAEDDRDKESGQCISEEPRAIHQEQSTNIVEVLMLVFRRVNG